MRRLFFFQILPVPHRRRDFRVCHAVGRLRPRLPANFVNDRAHIREYSPLRRRVQLYELSDRLSVFPGGRLIEEYRSVLTELLKRAAKGLRIKRDMRWRKTDRKLYVTIERAEKAMDELEEAFIYEGNRTKALALMEEIKGCLISLLM